MNQRNTRWWQRPLFLMVILLSVSLYPLPARAINFYTGGRMPDGLALNLYPYWFTADTLTDAHGRSANNHLAMDKYGALLGGSYYRGAALFNVLVPVGKIEVRSVRGSDEGLGDIQVRAGYFLPIKEVTILPVLAIKVPSGNFDKSKGVNLGDGQTDILAELYFNKIFRSFSVDWLLKYTWRTRNPDNNRTPGGEFDTEGLVTYKVTPDLRIGPSATFLLGGDNARSGLTIPNSGVLKVSVGGEVTYRGFRLVKLSFAALRDLYSQNSPEGMLLMGRLCFPLQGGRSQ